MRERVFVFGETLVGVLSEPEPVDRLRGAPAVIVSNVGLHHRIGPFRLYVDLARRLGSLGFTVLRFDLSGMGDSDKRPGDARGEVERAVAEVREAMDFVAEKTGVDRFVLMGLCSGVDHVHPVSVLDPRVVGAVQMDGYAYPTPKFLLHHYLRFLVTPWRWRNFADRWVGRACRLFGIRRARRADENRSEIYVRVDPPQDQLASELAQLARRGVALLFVYSGWMTHFYNYRNQLFDMFPSEEFRKTAAVERFDEADHIFSRLSDRERLLARLSGWMSEHFGQSSREGREQRA